MVNIGIVYEVNLQLLSLGKDFALGNSLFGPAKLTKNADFGKHKYSGYDIGFDACTSFSLSDGSGFSKNVIIFGADMSSSLHIGNLKQGVLILGKGPADGLDDTTLQKKNAL